MEMDRNPAHRFPFQAPQGNSSSHELSDVMHLPHNCTSLTSTPPPCPAWGTRRERACATQTARERGQRRCAHRWGWQLCRYDADTSRRRASGVATHAARPARPISPARSPSGVTLLAAAPLSSRLPHRRLSPFLAQSLEPEPATR